MLVDMHIYPETGKNGVVRASSKSGGLRRTTRPKVTSLP